VRESIPKRDPALHAASQGESRHHGMGTNQRLARQHLARTPHRVRPVLHPALVLLIRSENPDADTVEGVRQQERVLTPKPTWSLLWVLARPKNEFGPSLMSDSAADANAASRQRQLHVRANANDGWICLAVRPIRA